MAGEIAKAWDRQRLRRDRLKKLQAEMRRFGIGALYLSDPANIQYVINVRTRSSKVFVPAEGKPLALVRPRDIGYVKMDYDQAQLPFQSTSGPKRTGRAELPLEAIVDLMGQHNVVDMPLAVDQIDSGLIEPVVRSGVRVVGAKPVLDQARAVKTEDEIAIYRTMGKDYARTIEAFRRAIRVGISEHELASIAAATWFELGAENITELEVCSGERMNPWQRWPTQRTLRQGEFVAIDFHGRGTEGLIGDISRTYFVGGAPSPEQRELYLRACGYLVEITDTLRAGRSVREVLSLIPQVPEKYAEQLYDFSIVHSVGMVWSGSPEINKTTRRADAILQPNHVLTIESFFGEKGGPVAAKLERMVIIQEGEPEVLDSTIPLDDWILS